MESHPTHTPDKTDRNIKTIVKNFRCELCPAAFTTKNNLHVHQRDHTGEKPFMCHKCGKQFKRPMNLSIHMSTHNDRKQFGCVFCGKHFKHYTVLYKHVASYHELFRCDSCDKKFITEENLANHQSKHTGKKPFHCTRCSKKFTRQDFFERHLSGHKLAEESAKKDADDIMSDVANRGDDLKCIICNQEFLDLKGLYQHLQSHNADERHVCNICNKTFVTVFTLKSHLSVHTGKRPFVCTVCNRAFRMGNQLKYHTKIHTNQNYLRCNICDRQFSDDGNFRRHLNTHIGEKTHFCKICGKSFLTSANLKSHLTVHAGVKPYVCTHCSKAFRLKSQLRYHGKIHTDENHLRCSVCNKQFSDSGNFRRHLARHNGEKHLCDVCNKSFPTVPDLKNHVTVHTGIKPFACDYCNKSFRLKSQLNIHTKVHTDGDYLKCKHCNRQFTDPGNLKKHVKKFHDGEKSYECVKFNAIFCTSSDLEKHLKVHDYDIRSSTSFADTVLTEELASMGHGDAPGLPDIENKDGILLHTGIGGQNCFHPYYSDDKDNFQREIHSNSVKVEPTDESVNSIEAGYYPTYNASIADGSVLGNCFIGDQFSFGDRMKRHPPVPTDTNKFSCSECNRSFQSFNQLSCHMEIHAGVKNCWSCSLCDEELFETAGSFQQHMIQRHNIEKPFHCTMCDQYFEQNIQLQQHSFIHKG